MALRLFSSGLIAAVAAIPSAALAGIAQPAAGTTIPASTFTLVSSSAAPPRVQSLLPAAASSDRDAAMPRELPEVAADDARPIPNPVLYWHPSRSAVVKLRPGRVRLRMGF